MSRKLIDLTGKTVHGFRVIELSHMLGKESRYWKCICPVCGEICIKDGHNLREGNTLSCGCVKKLSNKKRKELCERLRSEMQDV